MFRDRPINLDFEAGIEIIMIRVLLPVPNIRYRNYKNKIDYFQNIEVFLYIFSEFKQILAKKKIP